MNKNSGGKSTFLSMSRISNFFQIVLIVFKFCLSLDAASLGEEFDHAAWLDENQNYKLYWTVKHADESIYLAAEVKTTGWIGFGISQGLSGMMRNADIAIAWVDATGKAHLKDCHGTGNVIPSLDPSQDYELTGSWQNSTTTVIKFKRKIKTCDSKDSDIVKGTTKVIYAIGNSDPVGNSFSMLQKHAKKGARSLNLLNYVKNTPVPSGTKYFDVLLHNITVPAKDTVYWCRTYKIADLVQLGSPQHIIEMAPVIQPRSEGLVHHILLYACKHDFNESHVNASGECYSSNMPPSHYECVGGTTFSGWAIGGDTFKLPNHVGLPIGTPDSIKYIVMEIHYDNPLKRSDFVDTSGMRLYYTAPRQYEAAIFSTGARVNMSMLIPPKQSSWTITGTCSKECTRKMQTTGSKSTDKINIIAALPHAHLMGTKIWTTLVRDGVEKKDVFRVDNYDFNYQQFYRFEKQVELRAGDELFTYCNYNSLKRKDAVLAGLGTSEEMCLHFFLYYPKTNFTSCLSEERLVTEVFAPKYSRTDYNASLGETQWTGVQWNSTMVNELKAIYRSNSNEAITDTCLGESSRYHFLKSKPRPIIREYLKPPKSVCLTGSSAGVIQANFFLFFAVALYNTITTAYRFISLID